MLNKETQFTNILSIFKNRGCFFPPFFLRLPFFYIKFLKKLNCNLQATATLMMGQCAHGRICAQTTLIG